MYGGGAGGTGGGSTTFNIRDYINEWMTANPDYLKDQIGTSWDNYLAGIGGFDPSQFMTNQQFQNYMSNYQPDMSNYMTNPAFQDWLSSQDWSQFDPSTYDWTNIFNQFGGGIGSQGPQGPQGPQPESTDMSNYMTNQQFQNYMSNYQPDFSNYMTNQAFQDYMSNYQPDLDMSQYVTQGGLNTALQGLGSLNTTNPSVADYSYNVNPFAR